MREPTNLSEMQQIMVLYNDLQNDVPVIEKKFPAISEQIQVLDKYDILVKDNYRKLERGIPITWTQYIETLDQAKKMINYAKVVLRDSGKI